MIKVDYYSTVTLIEDSLINGASPQELVLESLLMNVYTKNLNEGMESTLCSFAGSNTHRGTVNMLEGRDAIQMDYNKLEERLT